MSESEIDDAAKSRSLRKLRQFFRKSLTFQKFPSLQTLLTHAEDQDDYEDEQSLGQSLSSLRNIDHERGELHAHLRKLRQEIIDIKEKNTADLSNMTSTIKREMERVEQFGEQLDEFDQYVQEDKENIQIQMEEMEAKIHHQINDQYSDLQEAIEGLYLRMDKLEKIYQDQKQQLAIEEQEESHPRHLAVKVINVFLCLAQVVLVVINAVAETLRPISSNGANIAIICFILYLIAVLNDDEVGKATHRLFKRTFPGLWGILT